MPFGALGRVPGVLRSGWASKLARRRSWGLRGPARSGHGTGKGLGAWWTRPFGWSRQQLSVAWGFDIRRTSRPGRAAGQTLSSPGLGSPTRKRSEARLSGQLFFSSADGWGGGQRPGPDSVRRAGERVQAEFAVSPAEAALGLDHLGPERSASGPSEESGRPVGSACGPHLISCRGLRGSLE